MNCRYFHIILIALISISSTCNVDAQSAKRTKTIIQVEYYKSHTKTKSLVATLKIKEDRYVGFADAEIDLYNIGDTAKLFLGKAKTNTVGEAYFDLASYTHVYRDSSDLMVFEVVYEGSTTNKEAKREIKVKEVDLKISFYQEDLIKYIDLEAMEVDLEGVNTPIQNQAIMLYIKGTFSLLKIGQETTNGDGKVIVEFPVDMPGDTVGVLTIVAKIEESDYYGIVEARGVVNWGRPVPLNVEKHRGLGDTDAPLWMVYTLIILLSAVWFHYFYVIYLIVKIKLSRNAV